MPINYYLYEQPSISRGTPGKVSISHRPNSSLNMLQNHISNLEKYLRYIIAK